MKRRSGKTWLALLCLAGCNPPLVYDPQQPIAPNILDRTEPELELRVFFAGNNFDSVVKPKGMFFNGVRSDTFVPNIPRYSRGKPFSGERARTRL